MRTEAQIKFLYYPLPVLHMVTSYKTILFDIILFDMGSIQ